MWKTDYQGIHERRYLKLREEGRSGWSGPVSVEIMCHLVEKQLDQNGKLLELGCGDGSVSIALAERGFRVFGEDIVPMAIEWAAAKVLETDFEVDFQVGTVLELPFKADAFDLVLDSSCSHCIIGDDRRKFFSEAFRTLRNGGKFVLNCLCGAPSPELEEFFDTGTRCLVRNGVAGRYIGLHEDLIREVSSAGFKITDWRVQKHPEGEDELVLFSMKE